MNKLTPKILIIILLCILTLSIYTLSSVFCDNRVNDFFVKIITKCKFVHKDSNVVLVAIDDKSIERISWPWKRNLLSDIFDYIEISGANVIVYANLISYPDTYNPFEDIEFNEKISYNNKLINSYMFLNSAIAGDVLPKDYIPLWDLKQPVSINDKRTVPLKFHYKGVNKLPKYFLESANHLAFSLIPEDNDTVVRNYLPAARFYNKLYPSLALSAYSMYTGVTNFVLTDDFLCSDDDCKTLKMPVKYKKSKDYIGNEIYGSFVLYDWYRPVQKQYSHKVYSAIDVLDSYGDYKNSRKPILGEKDFKDKIVIIGLNADSQVWEQLSETPVMKKHADIDIHAVMIDNMLNNSFMTENKKDFTLLITLIFCLFIVKGFKNFKLNLILTSLLSLLYFVYYLYQYFMHIYVPPLSPILTMYSAAIFKNIYNSAATDRTGELLKRALGKYVSKDVMKQVLQNVDKLKVGGKRTLVTILFVDIRNFTSIAENYSPQEVSSILNEYFSVIEPLISKYHGIINKYMGDGILGVFGDPVTNEEHPLNAVKCASEIIENIKKLSNKFQTENKPKISAGIGINTGEVFAGNIGTEERLEYTVIGDNVNLAYRLESYNQVLKTQFLISESTYNFVKDKVDVVKLSEVSIKGKTNPVNIYEVLRIKH